MWQARQWTMRMGKWGIWCRMGWQLGRRGSQMHGATVILSETGLEDAVPQLLDFSGWEEFLIIGGASRSAGTGESGDVKFVSAKSPGREWWTCIDEGCVPSMAGPASWKLRNGLRLVASDMVVVEKRWVSEVPAFKLFPDALSAIYALLLFSSVPWSIPLDWVRSLISPNRSD